MRVRKPSGCSIRFSTNYPPIAKRGNDDRDYIDPIERKRPSATAASRSALVAWHNHWAGAPVRVRVGIGSDWIGGRISLHDDADGYQQRQDDDPLHRPPQAEHGGIGEIR